MNDFFPRLTDHIRQWIPVTESIPQPEQMAFVFSSEVISLPKAALQTVKNAVEAFYSISHSENYCRTLNLPEKPNSATDSSILMAYDFHIDDKGQLSLIEINTNASGFFLASLLYQSLNLKSVTADPLESLWNSLQQEWKAFHSKKAQPTRMAIVDDQIEKQNMYLEFQLFKSWMTQKGWPCELTEVDQLQFSNSVLMDAQNRQIDFVYNRWTDFLFAEKKSAALKAAYEANAACISPHPQEYLLLADKQRLIELAQPDTRAALKLTSEQQAALDAVLIPTYEVNKSDPDWLWTNRKKLFFKPKRSYGGKATYRGMSISKRTFEDVLKGDFLAQEYRPAPLHKEPWKYDLRFYVYRDQVQLAVARLYQGQVTNFSNSGGGFAAIQFI